jgi:alanine racemase
VSKIRNLKSRTWAEVDLDCLEYNYRAQAEMHKGKARICCVVKANAYGHGAAEISRTLEELGADFFAVADIDEAIRLRDAGVRSSILILGYTPPENAKLLAEKQISQCVYSYEYAEQLAHEATLADVRIRVHFKIDTGMGRIGFVFRHSKDESLSELLKACALEPFIHEGIFTHFPASDTLGSGENFTKQQFDRFCEVVELLEQNRYTFEIKHCSNSAAALYDPQYALDMVRVGLLLFGALPSTERPSEFVPKQTMTLKTVISNVKTVKAGDTIGYGCEYIAKTDMKIATVSIGYADGFLRTSYPNGIKLTVGGKECALVGRVCMDQSMIDVTEVENVRIGDEVVVFGNGGCNSLFDFALKSGTVPHEVLCLVGARVPRVYIRSNS